MVEEVSPVHGAQNMLHKICCTKYAENVQPTQMFVLQLGCYSADALLWREVLITCCQYMVSNAK